MPLPPAGRPPAPAVGIVYVTGHRNPDADSIASAVGYAELKGRLDPANEYRPVRLGEVNPQTSWLLEVSGADKPELLPHVMVRVCDVMQERFPVANHRDAVRGVGLTMGAESLDVVPIVDDEGVLVGVMTARAFALRYVRESRAPSKLDAPTALSAIVDVLQGRLVWGADREVSGQVWVLAMDVGSLPSEINAGDVVVVGDRADAQRRAIELGAALLVLSNAAAPSPQALALAEERGTAVVVSPLDSYVTSRMITLSAPCRALMDPEPLTVSADDLMADVADVVKEVHYGAAVVVDRHRRPVGLVTRSDLVSPPRRRILLVDHAEQAQSAAGVEQAEIVEILDHHHIGSIETTVPVTATFDPVGSTATLVIERFRQSGMEPRRSTATLLLGAIVSDTIILNSPTTTDRDRAAVAYLERVLGMDATEFGREMFGSTSDVSDVPAAELVGRDRKEYALGGGQTAAISQVETVGFGLLARRAELFEAMAAVRDREGYFLFAVMVTDIVGKGTKLLVSGPPAPLERAFGVSADDGVIDLPGVMSRKKQVAPRVLEAL